MAMATLCKSTATLFRHSTFERKDRVTVSSRALLTIEYHGIFIIFHLYHVADDHIICFWLALSLLAAVSCF